MLAFFAVLLESLTLTRRLAAACLRQAPVSVVLYVAGMMFWSLGSIEWTLAAFIVVAFAYVNLSIVIHRIILIGTDSVEQYKYGTWTWRETYYFLYMIGIGIVTFLVAYPFDTFLKYGFILSAPISSWFAGRLSSALPAIAIDRSPKFRIAWNLTVNRQLTMTLVMIFPAFFWLLMLLIGRAIYWLLFQAMYLGGWLYYVLTNLFAMVLVFLVVVIHTAMLTIAYRHLCEEID